MGRLGTFFLGFILGGITVYGSLHFHVIRGEDGFQVLPKLQATFSQTYVDIRGFGLDDWNRHRLLAAAITRSGKTELFRGAAVEPVQGAVTDFFNTIQNSH